MFINPRVRINNAISNVQLDTINNELYENGIRVATQTDIDTLQNEIDNIPGGNPNALITDTPLIIPDEGAVIISDGVSSVTTNASNGLKITDIVNVDLPLICNSSLNCNSGVNIQSFSSLPVAMFMNENNDFKVNNTQQSKTSFTNSSEYDFDNSIILKKGSLLLQNSNAVDALPVGLFVFSNKNFYMDNQNGSTSFFVNSSQYRFDNNLFIGEEGTTLQLLLNGNDIGAQVNTNSSNITTLQGQVSTNTTNIATNTSDISTINGKLKQNLSNYYVSTSGNNSTGDGTVYNPWATIGKAVTVLNALAGDITAVINVSAGNYAEASIVVTKSGISIIGANAISTVFTGNITFTMGANSSFYSIGNLSNISVVGTVFFNNPHNFSNSFTISGIISAPPNGKPCLTLSNTGSGTGGDVTVNNNSVFYANSDTVPITINQNASLFMVGCQIQNNPSPLMTNTIQTYINVLNAGRCNLFACSLYNASTNASVGALITINNSSAVSISTTINNCILQFTNGVATTTGAIINFTNSANITGTVNFYNNFCKCFLTQNTPNNYIILKSGAGTVTLAQGNNLGTSTNHTIPPTAGAFTKVDFSAVI